MLLTLAPVGQRSILKTTETADMAESEDIYERAYRRFQHVMEVGYQEIRGSGDQGIRRSGDQEGIKEMFLCRDGTSLPV